MTPAFRVQYRRYVFRGGGTVEAPETVEALNKLGFEGWVPCAPLRDQNIVPGPDGGVMWLGLFYRLVEVGKWDEAIGG